MRLERAATAESWQQQEGCRLGKAAGARSYGNVQKRGAGQDTSRENGDDRQPTRARDGRPQAVDDEVDVSNPPHMPTGEYSTGLSTVDLPR